MSEAIVTPKEKVAMDNAVAFSDDVFYKMMDDAWVRSYKDNNIDAPMVALHTLKSCIYILGTLGWNKKELYGEVDTYLDFAEEDLVETEKNKKAPN